MEAQATEQHSDERASDGTEAHDSVSAQISRAIVAIYKEYVGRGPTKVRTTIRDDLVVCVARDSMTKAERKLAEAGRGEFVADIRRTFQREFRDEAVAAVESLMHRQVVSFLSDHDVGPDIAVELFVLAPHAEPGQNADASGDGARATDDNEG